MYSVYMDVCARGTSGPLFGLDIHVGGRWQSIWPPSTVFTSMQSSFNCHCHQALVWHSAMPISSKEIYKRIRVCRKEGSVLRNRKVEVCGALRQQLRQATVSSGRVNKAGLFQFKPASIQEIHVSSEFPT